MLPLFDRHAIAPPVHVSAAAASARYNRKDLTRLSHPQRSRAACAICICPICCRSVAASFHQPVGASRGDGGHCTINRFGVHLLQCFFFCLSRLRFLRIPCARRYLAFICRHLRGTVPVRGGFGLASEPLAGSIIRDVSDSSEGPRRHRSGALMFATLPFEKKYKKHNGKQIKQQKKTTKKGTHTHAANNADSAA